MAGDGRKDKKATQKKKKSKARGKKRPAWEPKAEINMKDVIEASRTCTLWPASFDGELKASTQFDYAKNLSFHEVFTPGVDERVVLRWMEEKMGDKAPPVMTEVVNVVFWLRGVLTGGLWDQMSMTALTLSGKQQPMYTGNQSTYAAASASTHVETVTRGTTSSVYAAIKFITAGPPSEDIAAKSTILVMQNTRQQMPWSLINLQCKTENVVTLTRIDDVIDLNRLHALLLGVSKFEELMFPALIIKLRTGVTILVYQSGHIIATGSSNSRVLMYTTMFFLSRFVVFCLGKEAANYTMEQAFAATREGPAQEVLGGSRPHRVSDLFSSETGQDETEISIGKMVDDDDADLSGSDYDSDDSAASMSYSSDSDSDGTGDVIFASAIRRRAAELEPQLREDNDWTEEEVRSEALRLAKVDIDREQKKTRKKRQRTLVAKNAESGRDAASLSDLVPTYGKKHVAALQAVLQTM